jgi:hypothetical protein
MQLTCDPYPAILRAASYVIDMPLSRAFLVLATGSLFCFAQIGPQYPPPGTGGPGTGYPGGSPYPRTGPGSTGGTGLPRLPGRKKKDGKPTDKQLENLIDLRGMLRKLDEKQVILQADDKRFIQIRRTEDTRLVKNGADAKSSEFALGDHVIVEAAQDDKEDFIAVRINFDTAGTEKDKAAARGPLPETVRFEDDLPATKKDETRDGPPKLTRNKGGESKPAPAEEPKTANPPETKAQPAAASPVEEAEARQPGTIVVDKVELENVPKVKRGRPANARPRAVEVEDEIESANAPKIVASAGRPAVTAPGEAAPKEAPVSVEAPVITSSGNADPLLEKARESVLNFTEVLPNYLAKQMTTRFVGNGKNDRWQPQDNFVADVVYQDGKESYKNVMLNGKPAKGKIEETGAWSRGEFGTTLRDLFHPATAATFRARGNATIVNRKAKYYDFTVAQENSHWQIGIAGQTYYPEYKGSIWIDIETGRVLRLEKQGRKIPEGFPIDTIESAIDFDFVKIGGGSYLVPVHSESLACQRGGDCNKNVLDFRNYRKFGAQSDLILSQ